MAPWPSLVRHFKCLTQCQTFENAARRCVPCCTPSSRAARLRGLWPCQISVSGLPFAFIAHGFALALRAALGGLATYVETISTYVKRGTSQDPAPLNKIGFHKRRNVFQKLEVRHIVGCLSPQWLRHPALRQLFVLILIRQLSEPGPSSFAAMKPRRHQGVAAITCWRSASDASFPASSATLALASASCALASASA